MTRARRAPATRARALMVQATRALILPRVESRATAPILWLRDCPEWRAEKVTWHIQCLILGL